MLVVQALMYGSAPSCVTLLTADRYYSTRSNAGTFFLMVDIPQCNPPVKSSMLRTTRIPEI